MGFRVRSGVVLAVMTSMALAAAVTQAQGQSAAPEAAPAAPPAAAPATTAGNAERGKAISYTCLGCHGVPGYKNAYPNYSVPKLEGQHPEYIVIALQAYRSGERSHLTMHSQASTLAPNPSSQGKPPEAAQVCVACHGPDGVGITPQYPSLAGQHSDYLERALHDYKKGGRKNPIMATFAGQVKDADVRVIADYYSGRQPSLHTEPRPSTILTAGSEH
jgi:cytochrome c553